MGFFICSLGTLYSACALVKQQGGVLLECVVLIELVELNGTAKLPVKCYSVLQY